MADLERTPLTPAGVDRTAPAASRSAALAMIAAGDLLRKQGRMAEAMARYDAAALADPRYAPAHLSRGNLLLTGGRFAEARGAYQLAIACDPRFAAAHFNLGNLSYRAGEFAEALRHYQAALDITPRFAAALVGMANALAGLGRAAEAREGYQRAVALSPGSADAHFNLGVLAMTAGLPEEAAASLRRASELRPDHAPTHRMLGAVLSGLGDLEAAEASLRRAWSIAPESPEIAYDLAITLQYRGNYREALHLLARVLERAPNWTTKIAFGNCAARTQFTAGESALRAALASAISEAWVMPSHLCRPALRLLMLDERIAGCVRRANAAWPARMPRAELFGADGLAALSSDPLLHALLDAAPVNLLDFEHFLAGARHALLELASSAQTADAADGGALKFHAALARQCFINEYVFDCSAEEQLAADTCRDRLQALLDAGAAVPALLLLAVAAYFPLHGLRDPGRLLAAGGPDPIEDVLRQQVREPLEEQALRAGVPCLTPIAGSVSAAVREQYEESPYPRWVRMQMREPPLHFNAELRRALPFARFAPLPDDRAPAALVAGCGTGSDAILVAQRFRGVRVLAIDLSLSSIGYARRKTRELGLTNVEYAQADILRLDDVARTFDIIGAVGVLHHLADPFQGWRILLSRLRPAGFMCLGLYSRIARRPVVRARELIAARGYAGTPDDIRRFRRDVIADETSAELALLQRAHGFYSMSECRDLAFHVQERHLTLDEIGAFLTGVGLRFIGFELELRVLNQYRARFGDDPSCTELRNWARFEADNPDTFTGMYRFWVQRQPPPSAQAT